MKMAYDLRKAPGRRSQHVVEGVFAHVGQDVHRPSIHQEHGVPAFGQRALLGDVPEVVLEGHLQFEDGDLPIPMLFF